eukprot:GILI01022068.1.p1 GENE.GILI01022068.1~~GILI01022068.1.p1  ORF type:complete len:246 (-),score=49.77 GILI01022068.1:45-749(-)
MFGDHFESLPEDKDGCAVYSVGVCHSGDDTPDVKVTVTYPTGYPETASPTFIIESVSSKRRIQCANCLKEVKAIAEESIGMHCVTNVLQHIQSFIDESNDEAEKAALSKQGKENDNNSKSVVKSDPTIRMGNIVTPELFMEWQVKHLAEKAARKALETKKIISKSAGKMSGKQIWDVSIKDADWKLFEEGENGGLDVDEAGYEFALHDENSPKLDTLDEDNYDFDEEETVEDDE